MRIADTYSSRCRDLLSRADLEAIADAGPGEVRFYPSNVVGRRWGATVKVSGTSINGTGHTPGAAFRDAIAARTAA